MENHSPSSAKRSPADEDGQQTGGKSPSKKPRPELSNNSFSTSASLRDRDKSTTKRKAVGNSSAAPPKYGEQEYWEERYKNLAEKENAAGKSDDDDDKNAPLPYHSWYFTYEELRPIILPLILGGQPKVFKGSKDEKEDGGGKDKGEESKEIDQSHETVEVQGVVAENEKESNATESSETQPQHAKKNEEEDELVEVIDSSADDDANDDDADIDDDDDADIDDDDDDDDDDEESVDRGEGLAGQGPIQILEIGCGDVPLGVGLAKELHELQTSTGADARNVAKQVLCVDYSPAVIAQMQKEHSSLPELLQFRVADARQLSLSSASQHLILEKGTLDAMLSDPVEGIQKCHDALAEFERVLAFGGCLLLISHWNVHAEKGVQWLHDIVFEGLNANKNKEIKDSAACRWEIEVHGKEEEEGNTDGDDKDAVGGGPGPAVYIIHKRSINKDVTTNDDKDEEGNDNGTIPVRFFSY